MRLFIVIEKVCGAPAVHMATPDHNRAAEKFIEIVYATEAPREQSDEQLVEAGEFDYGDDCAIYLDEYEVGLHTLLDEQPGRYTICDVNRVHEVAEMLDQEVDDGTAQMIVNQVGDELEERWDAVTQELLEPKIREYKHD